MSAVPLSIFSIPIKPYGLLGTPDNLELHILERRRTAELVFTVSLIVRHRFYPAGLLRDVDAGHVGDTGGFQNLTGHALVAL